MLGKDIKYEVILLDEKSFREYAIDQFDCASENINTYIKETALKDYFNNKGVTKIIINSDNKEIIGFYTLSTTALIYESNNKNHYLPSIEIKFFAIDKEYQGLKYDESEEELNNFSNMMFFDILSSIRKISEEVCGVHNIILYSVAKAYNFYNRHGFKDFNEYMKRDEGKYIKDCIPLYMLI
ncbi:hypothetical protein [Clostridium sardiniense]|uniref:hypothetical protein n=1 Tax=Clostridium sardiniense TaxID=29369 RepID=UPI00195CDE63|nr:hypothetical protein [Clostridium sardiniense]MBM7835717.1 hypothetical protein [Clostridium sardiniense]